MMRNSPPNLSLEGLVATCNVAFSFRLLEKNDTEALGFEDFVKVADSLVGEDPRKAALHLAGLVAIYVSRDDPERLQAELGHN